MKKIFIHNLLFRIITPFLFGVLVYVLILMVYDNIESLGDNFINQEVIFCVAISYIMLELFRVQILLLDKFLPFKNNIAFRIFLQLITGTLLAFLISTGVVSIYFLYLLEYSKFSTELFTFNVIYIISAVLFNMIYISVAYLNMENDAKLEEEQIKRKNLEFQMRAFNNEINPNFLYASLETLIGLLHENEEDSELFIENLSEVYRYILSNKNNELVTLEKDLSSVDALLYVLNVKFHNQVSINVSFDDEAAGLQLIPGTVNVVIEKLVNKTIITNNQSLKIKCYVEDDYLVFQSKMNEKLLQTPQSITESLEEPYLYFTIKPIIELKAYGDLFVKIPLMEMVLPNEL